MNWNELINPFFCLWLVNLFNWIPLMNSKNLAEPFTEVTITGVHLCINYPDIKIGHNSMKH